MTTFTQIENAYNNSTKQDIYLREESIFIQGYRQAEKRIAELEAQMSNLLSCKNCPDNKGGYICQKEYENKCLAQKIQFIKELQEENAELKARVEKKDADILFLKHLTESQRDRLNKAKEIIRNLIRVTWDEGWNYSLDWKVKAEQFLKEVSE